MGSVLDASRRSLPDLAPDKCARVLVPEDGSHWLAMGEESCSELSRKIPRNPLTFVADESRFFQGIWSERNRILIADTRQEEGWQSFKGHEQFRSWLSVPLIVPERFLGSTYIGCESRSAVVCTALRPDCLIKHCIEMCDLAGANSGNAGASII